MHIQKEHIIIEGVSMAKDFFEEQREQSLIKSRIVSKYFAAWANVVLSTQKKYPQHDQKMAYVDLFAGPGRYNDQSKSTPILVLETILSNPELSNRMLTLFNDKDADNVESLKSAVNNLPNINCLTYKPVFYNEEVGEEIAAMFSRTRIVPTFFFVDPWGYKGLSLNLVSSIIKDWGCDCVFFFNYNRVNMGINNEAVVQHMTSLFGPDYLQKVKEECKDRNSQEREIIVLQNLCEALKQFGSRYVLPFRFRNANGTRTSHHLIFLSKSFRGYEIMKEIMYKESSEHTDGVASFEYNPMDAIYKQDSLLNMLSTPLDKLADMLTQKYAGKTIGFLDLYQEHSVDRPYVKKNYKDVLQKMYNQGIVQAWSKRTGKPPRAHTFSDEMIIRFVREE